MKRRGYDPHPHYGKGKFCQLCRCIKSHSIHTIHASHLNTPDSTTADLSKVESLTQWLDSKGDQLSAPDSFDQWLLQTEDTI